MISSRKELLAVHEIVQIIEDLVEGFAYLRNKQLAHLDIKCENILFEAGRYKFCDFGHSEYLANNESFMIARGTTPYMHPMLLRQFTCHSVSNVRFPPSVDIWSMGVVISKVVTLKLPFKIKGRTRLVDALLKKETEHICAFENNGMVHYSDKLRFKFDAEFRATKFNADVEALLKTLFRTEIENMIPLPTFFANMRSFLADWRRCGKYYNYN